MTVPPPRTRTPAPFPFPTWPKHVFVYTVHRQFCAYFTSALHLSWVLFTKRVTQSIAWKRRFGITSLVAITTFTLKAQWPVRAIGSIFMPRILGLAFRLPGTAWFHTLDDISNLVVLSFHCSSHWGSITSNLSSIAWFWFHTHLI